MAYLGRYHKTVLQLVSMSMLVVAVACGAAEFPVTYESISSAGLQIKYRATHAPFQNSKVISGRDAGLIGDGHTDNTQAFQKLFSKPGVNVEIEPGDYVTGRFVILGDTQVTLARGVTIRDSGHLGLHDVFLVIYGNHVKIIGNGAKIVQNRGDYTTGQGRHGVVMNQVSDVYIEGLESYGSGGDGFYITGPEGKPANNITLRDCIARNNRRQGLSITNGRHIDVINSTFSESRGTKPEFGIDLEPNRKGDVLDGILLFGVHTENNRGGGILIYMSQLDATSPKIDIEIVGHVSTGEGIPFITYTGPNPVAGSIRYEKVQ